MHGHIISPLISRFSAFRQVILTIGNSWHIKLLHVIRDMPPFLRGFFALSQDVSGTFSFVLLDLLRY